MSPYITTPDDIYVFFEMIEKVEPQSVIDIGMFLRRIGAISRQVKGKSIPENTIFDGFCTDGVEGLSIYKTVYNNIFTILPEKQYDLAIAMNLFDYLDEKDHGNICDWIYNAKYLFTDAQTFRSCFSDLQYKNVLDISIDENLYYLIFMKA